MSQFGEPFLKQQVLGVRFSFTAKPSLGRLCVVDNGPVGSSNSMNPIKKMQESLGRLQPGERLFHAGSLGMRYVP